MRPHLGRAALIGLMLAGGLLSAGISQAQDVGDQDARVERQAELVAASGGPASAEHLARFASDKAAVEVREDDVAPVATPAAMPVSAPVEPAAAPSDAARRVASADAPPPIPER